MKTRYPFSILQIADRTRGFYFDLGITAGNFLFLWPVFDNVQELPDKIIGVLLLVAVGVQGLGAVLKRGPLGTRLSEEETVAGGGFAGKFMQLLLFLHFLLFTVLTLLGLGLAGIVDLSENGSPAAENFWVFFSLFVGALGAYLVWQAGNPPSGEQGSTKPYTLLLEVGADLLLWLSVLIITRLIWEGLFINLVPMRAIGLSWRGITLLVSISILFIVFYMPSRYLFLVEDYHYPGTWLQVWLPMLPVAWSIFVG